MEPPRIGHDHRENDEEIMRRREILFSVAAMTGAVVYAKAIDRAVSPKESVIVYGKHQTDKKSIITHCLIKPREDQLKMGGPMFNIMEDGSVIIRLDRYAIIPIEDLPEEYVKHHWEKDESGQLRWKP